MRKRRGFSLSSVFLAGGFATLLLHLRDVNVRGGLAAFERWPTCVARYRDRCRAGSMLGGALAALVARCRCMSYGICLAWTTCIGFGFRPTWLGPIWQVFRSVRFPDLAGFGSRISRCVCVTDFDDGPGRMIGLRAFRPGLAIEPQALRPGWQELVADVKGRCSRQVLAVRDPPCMSSRSGSECFDLRWRPELQEL